MYGPCLVDVKPSYTISSSIRHNPSSPPLVLFCSKIYSKTKGKVQWMLEVKHRVCHAFLLLSIDHIPMMFPFVPLYSWTLFQWWQMELNWGTWAWETPTQSTDCQTKVTSSCDVTLHSYPEYKKGLWSLRLPLHNQPTWIFFPHMVLIVLP